MIRLPASFSSSHKSRSLGPGGPGHSALGHSSRPVDLCLLFHLTRRPSTVLSIPAHHDRRTIRRVPTSCHHHTTLLPSLHQLPFSPTDHDARGTLLARALACGACNPIAPGQPIAPASCQHHLLFSRPPRSSPLANKIKHYPFPHFPL